MVARKLQKKRKGLYKRVNSQIGSGNKRLIALVVGLIIFGIIMVYDSSVIVSNELWGDQFRFVKYHILWLVIGLSLMAFLYYFDYHKLVKVTPILIALTVILLILVLIVAKDVNGAKRWFEIQAFNFNFTLQPSELAKITFIIYLAAWLSKERKQKIGSLSESIKYHFTHNLGYFLLVLGTVTFLILLEPDLGTALIIAGTSVTIYFISSSGFLHNVGSLLIVSLVIVMGLLATIIAPYRFQRIMTFTQFLKTGEFVEAQGRDYQLKQVLTAVGSGGVTGVGFGESKQKFFYLVDITPFTDSIFAVYAEEFGLIGSILLIAVFLYFAYLGFKIAKQSPDKLGFLLASGITVWITLQALLHIGANSAVMPVTGITLPLVSYGGSSIIITLAGVGILLNVSRWSREN